MVFFVVAYVVGLGVGGLLRYYWPSAVVKANSLILCIPAILIERQAILILLNIISAQQLYRTVSQRLPPNAQQTTVVIWQSHSSSPSSSLFLFFSRPRANFYTFMLRIFILHRIVFPSMHHSLTSNNIFLSFSSLRFSFLFFLVGIGRVGKKKFHWCGSWNETFTGYVMLYLQILKYQRYGCRASVNMCDVMRDVL